MKERLKKVFSWKGLRNVAIVGLGIIGGFALVSMVGLFSFVGSGLSIALSAISTGVALAGLATTGIAVAAMGVKGIVNGVRYLFSKNYRTNVKTNRLAKKREKEMQKQAKLEQKQQRNSEKAKNQTLNNEGVEENSQKSEDVPVKEVTPVVAKEEVTKVSKKAGGYYDNMSEENKKLYDTIIKRNSKSIFGNLSMEEVAKMKETYAENVKGLKAKIKAGQNLNTEEEAELAKSSALYTKAHNRLKKMIEAAAETANVTEEQLAEVTKKATQSRR